MAGLRAGLSLKYAGYDGMGIVTKIPTVNGLFDSNDFLLCILGFHCSPNPQIEATGSFKRQVAGPVLR